MKFDAVREVLGDTPYLGVDEGWELYHHVLNEKPEAILELGHAHGVSTLYLAAALDELGRGSIDSVDLLSAADRQPNLEMFLLKAGLEKYVTIHREKNSYNWFLKKKIEAQSENSVCAPCYDFCFIDGPKNWTIDGFAFFLADKLLHDKAWILFDDMNWTHGKHKGREATDGITIRSLSAEEIENPQIEAVYRLLVLQNPAYSNFKVQDDWWAWAQKTPDGARTVEKAKKSYES
jgi:predicted O-methyltransferase YrrM